MPRLPSEVAPNVRAAPTPPSDYQEQRATPESFGGAPAAALQRAGAQGVQASSDVLDAARQVQEFHNEIAGTQAMNGFQHGLLDVSAKYNALTGSDAMYSFDGAKAQVDQLRDSIRGNLQNDAQRHYFDQAATRYQYFTLERMGSHYDEQQKVYASAQNADAMDLQDRHVAQYYNDDNAFFSAAHDNADAAVNRVRAAYGQNADPAMLKSAVADATGRLVLSRAQAWAANDPAGALNWVQNGTMPDPFGANLPGQPRQMVPVKSLLSGQQQLALTRELQAGGDRASVAAGANVAIGATDPGAVAQGAKINSAWQRLLTQEHGEDAQGNALVSPKGATGLTQMEPATAQETAQRHGVPYRPEALTPGPNYDSSYANMMGRLHFGDEVDEYGGNITLATAAYNAGDRRVQEWITRFGDPRKGTISDAAWAGQIPFAETRKYVAFVAQPGDAAAPAAGAAVPGFDASGKPLANANASGGYVIPAAAGAPAPASGPAAGNAQHNPAAYGSEFQMVQNAWAEAQRRFPTRPDLQRQMVDLVYQHIQETNVLQQKYEAEQAKAVKEQQDGLLNTLVSQAEDPSKIDPRILDTKGPDGRYVLTPEQRAWGQEFQKRALAEHGIDDTAPYGPGYTRAYNDIFAAPGDPNKITDLSDILKRGAPGGDLSTAGVNRLASVFTNSRKSPDQLALGRTEAAMLTYAKQKLSFDEASEVPGVPPLKDPKGEAIFNAQFVPKFEAGLSAATQAGDPAKVWQYLSQENVDKMLAPLRNPAQMARDRLVALGEAPAGPADQAGAPLPPVPVIQAPATSEDSGLSPQQILERNKAWTKPGVTDFQTHLDPQDEAKFRAWVTQNKVPFNPGDATPDYDMRGFWKGLQAGDARAKQAIDPNDGRMHFPDWWKTPYDYTFSRQSQYAGPNAPHWTGDDKLVGPDGKVLYDDRAPKNSPPGTAINPQAWHAAMTGPLPQSPGGTPFTHAAWAKALTLLMQNPDAKTIQQFNQVFGVQGFDGAEIVRQLTGGKAPAPAQPAQPAQPPKPVSPQDAAFEAGLAQEHEAVTQPIERAGRALEGPWWPLPEQGR